MKPLIVILLMAISVQAQTLADIARQERARRAQINSTNRVVTSVVSIPEPAAQPAPAETKPAEGKPAEGKPTAGKPGEAKPAEPAANAAKPATPAPPAVDPVKEWNARADQVRRRVQELQDQETALQLQLNQITNQVFAPVIDQATKDQAQARLGEIQNQLTATRAELDQTKRTLDSMVQQGPPGQPALPR
jgi:hypothetical protein